MLATGGSAVATVNVLKRWGVKKIKFVGLIGAPEGIRLLQEHHPEVPIYLAAIDERLNANGYILPGLGDAGDRQFGARLRPSQAPHPRPFLNWLIYTYLWWLPLLYRLKDEDAFTNRPTATR